MSRHEPPITDAATLRDLDAIDRALAGETVGGPVAPVAELAVTLRSLRAEPAPAYAHALDARAAAGFRGERTGPAAALARLRPSGARAGSWLPGGLRSLALRPAAGAAAAVLAAVAVAIAVWPSGSARHAKPVPAAAGPTFTAEGRPTPRSSTPAPSAPVAPGATTAPTRGTPGTVEGGTAVAPAPVPPEGTGGEGDAVRRVERSSTLDVGVAPDAIQSAAQRVFSIVSSLGGHVRQSTVTSQSDRSEAQGGASFDISVPSSKLSPAIASLSRLGHVRSESDSTSDVTGRYDSLQATLSHARAERASLLVQLAAATSGARAEAINARLHHVEARIAATSGALRALKGRLDFAPLALSLTPERAAAGAGALTPGAAAGSAAEILQTALAVLVIGLAAALPAGLALLAGRTLLVLTRRRVREQALDAS